MTDEEIRTRLLQADDLLRQYVALVQPVAEALAERHNASTGWAHEGHLGCNDEGIDSICLHWKSEGQPGRPGISSDQFWLQSWHELQEQFFKDLEFVNLSAYF